MNKISIRTERAPEPVGPYSQAILHSLKYTLELSGQVGIDPGTKKLVEGLEAQTRQVLDNIGGVLSEIGWDFSNITKARIYLTNEEDYGRVNKSYAERFGDDPPARAVVTVGRLPMGALLEIECVAGGNTISASARRRYF